MLFRSSRRVEFADLGPGAERPSAAGEHDRPDRGVGGRGVLARGNAALQLRLVGLKSDLRQARHEGLAREGLVGKDGAWTLNDVDVTRWPVAADRDPGYSYETTGTAWHILNEFAIPALLGIDIDSVEKLQLTMGHIRGHHMAKAGLEMAFWDLVGKEKGQSGKPRSKAQILAIALSKAGVPKKRG